VCVGGACSTVENLELSDIVEIVHGLERAANLA